MPLAVRGTPAELEALAGQRVVARSRALGKFLDLDLDRDRVVVNPMLTGRFQLAAARREGAVRDGGGARVRRPDRRSAARRRRVDPRRGWLPADDDPVIVRYRDPTQMGKVYLLPAGVERPSPVAARGEMGPDALDPALTLEVWRERIRKHPGELKNLLRNQAFVAGIGNAYSDEILYAARLQPFRKRSSLAPEEVDELYAAMRSTLDGVGQAAARTGPADVREAGPRPPRRPQPGRRGLPAVRDADHPGHGRRVPDGLLPGLPALISGRHDQDLARLDQARVGDVVGA